MDRTDRTRVFRKLQHSVYSYLDSRNLGMAWGMMVYFISLQGVPDMSLLIETTPQVFVALAEVSLMCSIVMQYAIFRDFFILYTE